MQLDGCKKRELFFETISIYDEKKRERSNYYSELSGAECS